MPRPQTAAIQAALSKFNRAQEKYLETERVWQAEWDSKASPFASVAWYCSPEQRRARAKAMAPVTQAKRAYEIACQPVRKK